MDPWEYRVETMVTVDDTAPLLMNAASGWELYSIAGLPGKYLVSFKRLRTDEGVCEDGIPPVANPEEA